MSEQAAEQQAQSATARVLAILAAYQAAQLTQPDAQAAMAAAIYTGKVLASRLADITVSTWANLPPLGIVPGPQHVERLQEAVSTALDEPETAPERLERLATAETLESHRASLHAAIRDHGFTHWQRIVQSGACEICAPHADEIQPVSVGFKDHPGCRCSLIPHGQPSDSDSEPTQPRPLVTIRRTA